jgi:ElaB/YqjD/DUF883 family membrane-anchored ribosome-binding protein
MSEYLKNLQESVMTQHSFIRAGDFGEDLAIVTEEELKMELDGIFEDESSLNSFIYDFITEDLLVELNTGAIKSLRHLLKTYQDKFAGMKGGGSEKMDLSAKMGDIKRKIAALEKGGKEIKDRAKAGITDKAGEVADKAKDALSGAKTKGAEVADNAKNALDSAKEKAGEAGEKVGGAVKAAGEYISQNPGTSAAIAAGAAAAIAAGVLAYKKFFSKGAKACKNAPDKKECMKELKRKAVGARIAAMNAGKAKCAGNPKCNAKIDAKAAALKSKMESI